MLLAGALGGCGYADLRAELRPAGRSGTEPWPDVVAGLPRGREGRRDSALILSVEDYRGLSDRPGAHAAAGAWYRYLREAQGVKKRRIAWLRDDEVTPRRVRAALTRIHFQVGRGQRIWVIFIGHAYSGESEHSGTLLRADATAGIGEQIAVRELLARAGHGQHGQLVAVLDGCWERTDPDLRSGTPASSLPSLRPTGLYNGRSLGEAYGAKSAETGASRISIGPTKRDPRVERDIQRQQNQATEAIVFTAGVGEGCREDLPGAPLPALSYVLLGAIRGWADSDGDGRVTASEAGRHASLLLRAASHGSAALPRPQSRGMNILLTAQAGQRGPSVSGVLPPDAVLDEAALVAGTAEAFIADRVKSIRGGEFVMGCRSRLDPNCEDDERPPREIQIDRYAIDLYEVTWEDYAGCVAEGGCRKIALEQCMVWTGKEFVRGAPVPVSFQEAHKPVVCATWEEAATYCAWAGKRLPTEAEWERAARGPSARTLYPWGDAPPSCARAQVLGCGEGTAPVGAHPAGASPEGIFDLVGNAAEWTADWYDEFAYKSMASQNPVGPPTGDVRVVRGGSFYDDPEFLRISYRYGLTPGWGYGMVGFRCAR